LRRQVHNGMIVTKTCCFTCQSIPALAANCQGSLKLVYDSSRQMSLVQCAITQSIYIHRSFSLAPKRFVRSAIMLWYLSVAGEWRRKLVIPHAVSRSSALTT
ncbi:hypothetical protein T09_1079, partial [Trichinella sp. T9]